VRIIITGAAGFIGGHLARRLLDDGHEIWGIDNFSPYYDVAIKEHRWTDLCGRPNFHPCRIDIVDRAALDSVFATAHPEKVYHLAAQAGVRHSLEAPDVYLSTNVLGTWNIIDAARKAGVAHLVFSSTSSAYGARENTPFRETDTSAQPVSLYAATKLSGEALAHSQSHLHGLPVTALRFFTVYGPEGRPDMAPHLFTEAILKDQPITVFNHGDMARDFTFVGDIVEAMMRVGENPPVMGQSVAKCDSLSPVAPFRVVNIGQDTPVALLDFIKAIETATGRKAKKHMRDMQPGDVRITHADPSLLKALTGYVPTTSVSEGVSAYVDWFRHYHGLS